MATAVFASVVAVSQTGAADDRGHREHDHDFRRDSFRGHDGDRWHREGWRHEWHHRGFGWWGAPGLGSWGASGFGWSNYGAPVYFYPEYAAPIPPPPATWYYCANPPGYYPYIAQCYGPWQPLLAP